MNGFLATFDQWALGVLMGICSLFGVKELPQNASSDWRVEQQWVLRPDGYYLLQISSETAQEICRSGDAKYLIFPQTYMAKQEVFADNIKVYTNEMDKEWHIKSFLDRPVVSCDLLGFAKKIEFKVLSYEKYFASINAWPYGAKMFPGSQSFYNFSYAVVGLLAVFVSLAFFLIGIVFKEKYWHILVLGTGIFLIMYSHYPAYAIAIHVHLAHQFTLVGILAAGYAVIFEEKINNIFFKWNWILLLVLIIETKLSYKLPNPTQFFMNVNTSLVLSAVLVLSIKEKIWTRKLMLFSVFFLGVRDFYGSQVLREGFLNLSLLSLIIIFFISYQIVLKIHRKNVALMRVQEKFENERSMIEKMTDVNLRIKQIVHDMKSPVTSLNFMVAAENIQVSSLLTPLKRLNRLLDMSTDKGAGLLLDWYSVKILDNAIHMIVEEKKYLAANVKYRLATESISSVFFDPELVKLLVAELILNSVKNNSSSVHIEMSLEQKNSQHIVLKYKDNGVGIAKEKIKNIGTLGYSSRGTGVGIFSMLDKVETMRAELAIDTSVDNGFYATIKFQIS